MDKAIPISVIVVTRNEETNIARCLESAKLCDDIWVVDSNSNDNTTKIANDMGVNICEFTWNGQYPKKRQWCLDNLQLKYNYVFFIDADEQATHEFMSALSTLDFQKDGYFISGRYCLDGHVLKHGLYNKKLCLFDRRKFKFPIVDDLDIEGMGEIEGHYQPVPIDDKVLIGSISEPIFHHAFDDQQRWQDRHQGYADWEDGMISRKAYPQEVSACRKILKAIFHAMPSLLKASLMFVYGYVLKGGFMDGVQGLYVAQMKSRYYLRNKR